MLNKLLCVCFVTVSIYSFSFTKYDQRVMGKWHSSKLKSTFNLKPKGNFTLSINTKKLNFIITGKWRATKKYLYLEYFSLKTDKTEKTYYKTMIYRINKITDKALILKHRYSNALIVLKKT